MKFRFFPKANKRLDEIWQYTAEQWDQEKAEIYIRGLFNALEKLADQRSLWCALQQSGFEGVYFFRYKHHFVFFRELNDYQIGVISILHEKMNLPHRLKEDACEG